MSLQEQWCGVLDYEKGLTLQQDMVEKVREHKELCVLGCEHPEVLTLGLRSQGLQDVLDSENKFHTVSVRRGGEATIHNPGQLVIYPIVPLQHLAVGVRDFVCVLIKASKDFFLDHGVVVMEKGEPGLYTEHGKIAFVGVQVVRGVTLHGLSINISNELEVFNRISVCGVQGQSMDRLAAYKETQSLDLLFSQWMIHFNKHWANLLNS